MFFSTNKRLLAARVPPISQYQTVRSGERRTNDAGPFVERTGGQVTNANLAILNSSRSFIYKWSEIQLSLCFSLSELSLESIYEQENGRENFAYVQKNVSRNAHER